MFPGKERWLSGKITEVQLPPFLMFLSQITLIWVASHRSNIKTCTSKLLLYLSSIRTAQIPLPWLLDLEMSLGFRYQNLFWVRSRSDIQHWEYVEVQVWPREWRIEIHPVVWLVDAGSEEKGQDAPAETLLSSGLLHFRRACLHSLCQLPHLKYGGEEPVLCWPHRVDVRADGVIIVYIFEKYIVTYILRDWLLGVVSGIRVYNLWPLSFPGLRFTSSLVGLLPLFHFKALKWGLESHFEPDPDLV